MVLGRDSRPGGQTTQGERLPGFQLSVITRHSGRARRTNRRACGPVQVIQGLVQLPSLVRGRRTSCRHPGWRGRRSRAVNAQYGCFGDGLVKQLACPLCALPSEGKRASLRSLAWEPPETTGRPPVSTCFSCFLGVWALSVTVSKLHHQNPHLPLRWPRFPTRRGPRSTERTVQASATNSVSDPLPLNPRGRGPCW